MVFVPSITDTNSSTPAPQSQPITTQIQHQVSAQKPDKEKKPLA